MGTTPPSSSALRASHAPEMPFLFPFDCLPASIGHWVRDAVLGKKTVFGREMTEVGDVGVVKKKIAVMQDQSPSPLPDPG